MKHGLDVSRFVLVSALLIGVLTGLTISRVEAASHDSGLWQHSQATVAVNPRMQWLSFVELRTFNDFSDLNQVFLNSFIDYKLNDHWRISGGGAYLGISRNTLMDELRPWQGIQWSSKADRAWTIALRQIFEERFFIGFRDPFGLRLRELVKVDHALDARMTWKVFVSEELYLSAPRTSWGGQTPWDQNRAMIGLKHKLNDGSSWSVAYLNQHVFRENLVDVDAHLLYLEVDVMLRKR